MSNLPVSEEAIVSSRAAGGVPRVSVIDLFSGAGGLSLGLRQAGLSIAAGIDVDASCQYPFETNVEAPFLRADVRDVTAAQLARMWAPDHVRLLAGCAPCQPFSPYRRGVDTSEEEQWPLLDEFGRLVRETLPELVSMENVPRIGSSSVFRRFVALLKDDLGYHVSVETCYGPMFGLPQHRRRLVLLASRLGPIGLPERPAQTSNPTVRAAIAGLSPLASGESDPHDPLHRSRALSSTNLKRIRASKPGGSWNDWPEELRAPCHRRASGVSFRNVYARMEWDKPSPTITTLAYNYGAGRFGHPEQDRALSLREAALLQGFPAGYSFVPPGAPVRLNVVSRLIGNAVPPPIAAAAGRRIMLHVAETFEQGRITLGGV